MYIILVGYHITRKCFVVTQRGRLIICVVVDIVKVGCCESRHFRAVHIFKFSAFLKYLQKYDYIQLENYFYYTT